MAPSSCEQVRELTDDTFHETRGGAWIVKFYAPWCGHCKRLAPVFEEAAKLAGPGAASFAMVDCTQATRTAGQVGVRGYPTLKAIVNGKLLDLDIPRTARALAGAAKRLARESLVPMESHEAMLEALAEHAGPAFGIGQGADRVLRASFENVARDWKHEQLFLDLQFSEKDQISRLEVLGDQVLSTVPYTGRGDAMSLTQWVRDGKQRWPFMTELDHTNFAFAVHAGKPVAVAIIDPAKDASKRFLASFRNLSLPDVSPLPPHVREAFLFASLDGVLFETSVTQYNVSPDSLPRVVVIDGASRVFFEDPLVVEISDVPTFLQEVQSGAFPAQRSGVWKYPTQIYNAVLFGEHGVWVALGVVLGALVLLGGAWMTLTWCCSDEDTLVSPPSAEPTVDPEEHASSSDTDSSGEEDESAVRHRAVPSESES
jgi:thiol-disulfide isomerase/thioredoxin